MLEIVLFLGICFFGFGDCEEVEQEELKLLVNSFTFKGYNWTVTNSEHRQGIIGEVIENRVTFASGNYYIISNGNDELEAGQIITIRMDWYKSQCELERVSLNNATTYHNIRDIDLYENIEKMKFKTDEELEEIQEGHRWEDHVWWKFSELNPTAPCANYAKYFLESIDGKLAEAIPTRLQ